MILVTVVLLGGLPVGPRMTAEAATALPTIIGGWGDNYDGQLGNLTFNDTDVPVAVSQTGALSQRVASTISSGAYHECALATGKPYCWGWGSFGQLGNNTFTWRSEYPVAVDTSGVLNAKTITAIAAGEQHTCVIADAKPYCWGDDQFGQLGDNGSEASPIPVAVDTSGVLSGKTVTAITAGNFHTCVIADARAYCWGSNGGGALGNNSTEASPIPVAVDTSGVLAGKTITAISAGGHTCVIADGQPFCWGGNGDGQLGNDSFGDSSVPVAVHTSGVLSGTTTTAVAAGERNTCVVADAAPYCWGANGDGQLGNDSTNLSDVPVAVITSGVLSGKTVTGVDVGGGVIGAHACAIANDRPYCWGNNDNGQLGNDNVFDTYHPVAVNMAGVLSGKVAVEISTGGDYSATLAMTDPGFCDVAASSQFFIDIVWLNAVGITSGYADGCFRPTLTVSRQAMAAFLRHALHPGEPEPTCTGTVRTFTDVPASNPFCGHIEWLATSGITSGFADGTFGPTRSVSRQAMATFLRHAITPGVPEPTCTGTERTFTDVPASNPFCGHIEWLATSGITSGFPDGTFRPALTVSRQAMGKFLHRALT